jgi:hypothetical protein
VLVEDAVDLFDLELDDENLEIDDDLRLEIDDDLPSLLLELIRIMLLGTSGSSILSSFVFFTSWLGSGD